MSIIDKKYLNKIKSSINFQFENKLFSAEIKDEVSNLSYNTRNLIINIFNFIQNLNDNYYFIVN